MPKQEDDIFKFDPTSFWQSTPYYQEVNYIPVVNQQTGAVVLIPASKLETKSEQEIIQQVDQYHYRYNLCKNGLEPEHIEEAVQWLREKSILLNLVARQLGFHLLRLYRHLIKVHLKKTPDQIELDLLELPPTIINIDREGNLIDAQINLGETEVDQIIKHLEQELIPGLEKANIWSETAKELLASLAVSAIENKEQELGIEAVENMSIDSLNETIYQYFNGDKSDNLDIEIPKIIRRSSIKILSTIAQGINLPDLTITELDLILGFRQDDENKPIPITESRLTNAILPIPSFAAFKSAITAQLRTDLWKKDHDGFAYFKHQAKGNSQNYIEHYISSPGDIELLPLEQAEQIIDKFGFNTVKLHLIFAAHTMNQERPWDGKFSLKASDVIKDLGWDKRTDLPVHQKLNEIAKTAFVLDCLLVKSVWIEGRNKKGGIDASTPTGRMWNVVVDPRGEQNSEGKIEQPKEVYITVQPGLIFHSFLNKAGSKLKEALYQFGYLAQDILRIDPYHDELALRLAIHLAMDSRVHTSGKYQVETLLKHLLPHAKIDTARSDTRRGYDLKQRWDNALKLLKTLNWQIQFDESYPSWLQPGNKFKKPADTRKMKIIEWLLQAKITIQPPQPIPELLATKVKPKLPSSKQKKKITGMTGITSDQIRKGRNGKGWSQRKLAGCLGVSNALIGYWEKGKRTPSEEMEIKLRELLQIED
jgi:transcriptional regulator with XRE-family HTH domain